MDKLAANISINKQSNGIINVQLRDHASMITFVEFTLTLEAFAQAITGLSDVGGEMEVRGLANVGLSKEMQHRSVTCPFQSLDVKKLRAWLIENCQEQGWEIVSHLSSINSVVARKDGRTTLNYRVIRYVKPETADAAA